jgi:RHS repeat-associated protein
VYYYVNDQLGTPQKLVTDAGVVVWSASVDAFGLAHIDGASTAINPLRFAGQYYDTETGLHQNYFRDYDPETGRYLQADPIGMRGGLNVYIYANLNPLVYFDSWGLKNGRPNNPSAGNRRGPKGQYIPRSNPPRKLTLENVIERTKKGMEDGKQLAEAINDALTSIAEDVAEQTYDQSKDAYRICLEMHCNDGSGQCTDRNVLTPQNSHGGAVTSENMPANCTCRVWYYLN